MVFLNSMTRGYHAYIIQQHHDNVKTYAHDTLAFCLTATFPMVFICEAKSMDPMVPQGTVWYTRV